MEGESGELCLPLSSTIKEAQQSKFFTNRNEGWEKCYFL